MDLKIFKGGGRRKGLMSMQVITYDTTIKSEDEKTGEVKLVRVCNTCRVEGLIGEVEINRYIEQQHRVLNRLVRRLVHRRGERIV